MPVVLLLPVASMATHIGAERQGEGEGGKAGKGGHMLGLAILFTSKLKDTGRWSDLMAVFLFQTCLPSGN